MFYIIVHYTLILGNCLVFCAIHPTLEEVGFSHVYCKVVPLGFRVMEYFLQAGFLNKEIIIKEQHNCRSTDYWKKQDNNFLLLAHEYIFVFQK